MERRDWVRWFVELWEFVGINSRTEIRKHQHYVVPFFGVEISQPDSHVEEERCWFGTQYNAQTWPLCTSIST